MRTTPTPFIAALLVSLGMASSAFAQSSWTSITGPSSPGYGGYVRDIRNPTKYVSSTSTVADTKVWMATDGGGVHSSEDNGATWVKPAGTLTNKRVFSMTSFSSSTATSGYRLILGTLGGGVVATGDAGASFYSHSTNNGLSCQYVRTVRVISVPSGTSSLPRLFAGTDCEGSSSGIYYQDVVSSTSNWTQATGIPSGTRIFTIAPVGATSAAYNTPLMAGTSKGIYKSVDNGQTWTALANSPQAADGSSVVYGVTYFSATAPLYAAVEGAGVFVSKDSGVTWTASNTGLPTSVPLVPSSGFIGTTDSGSTLFITLDGLGLYKSTDQAATWTQFMTAEQAGNVRFMTSWTTAAGYRFLGTRSGVWATNDATFATPPTQGSGQPGGMADNIEVDSAGVVYAGMASGVYKLNTTTSSWDKVGGNLPDMLSGNIKVRGTDVYASTTNMGVYKLTGGQGTWQAMNTGLPSNLVGQNASIRIDTSTTNSFYVGLNGAGFYYWNGTATSPKWEARNTGLTGNALKVRSSSTFGQAVLLSTDDGVYYSANAGASWVFKGPADSSGNRLRADQVAIDQSNASTLYAAVSSSDASGTALTSSGLWKSTDTGATWTQVETFKAKHVHHVRVGFTGSKYITLVGVWDDMTTGGGGLYVSEDGGLTWSTVNTGLTTSLIGSSIPLSTGGGYLATRGGGIFSINSGSSSGGSGTGTSTGTGINTGTTTGGTGTSGSSASSISLIAGWNLVGNSTTKAMPVSTYFGDKTKVTSVWAWSASTSSWAFYSPALSDGGVAYAATKGYTALTTIEPGAGFWVNAASAQTVTLPSGSPYLSTFFIENLPVGWSLNSIGDSLTPRSFNNSLSITPPSVGSVTAMFVTLWAWDAKTSSWYFYAPSLDDSKGSLTTYATGKGYLDFGTKVLSPGMGFWVNQK